MTTAWKPTGVSFSSGGAAAVVQFGALARLNDAGTLSSVRHWYGCSAGALAAFLGLLEVGTSWLREACGHFNANAISQIEQEMVSDFFNSWGMNSGKQYVEFLSKFLEIWEPGCSSWTFSDIEKVRPGKTLTIVACNLSKGCQAIFSNSTTPSMKIMDAIQASGSIPLFYKPWIDPSGNYYSDGAIMEYYPWNCVPDKDNTLVIACSDTGITGRALGYKKITTINEFIERVSNLMQLRNTDETPKYWIAINNQKYGVLDFDMTNDERIALFDEGSAVVDKWLAFQPKVRAFRIKERDSASETHKCSEDRGLPCASSVAHCSPNNRLESPGSHSPAPQPHSSQDLQTSRPRPSRRWSL